MSKSDRKLRSGTRKDYGKIACVDGDSSEAEREPDSPNSDGGHRGKQQQQMAIMDGGIINTEFPAYSSSDDGAASSESEPDEEIAQAQEKLKLITKEKKRLMKKKKLERIARETEEAEKSLEKMKKPKQTKKTKRKGKKVTVDSLRDMEDVVVKVDKLMDKEMKLSKNKKKVVYSSSSSDSDSSTSSDSEDSSNSNPSSDSEPEKKKKGKKHEVEKTEKKEKKRRSGKSKRLTSDVLYPQKWPQSLLSLHFVNKDKKYEDLTISEFCAGYASILEMTSKSKMGHRIAHLKELMYLSTKYQWKCVLNYHAACLLEIERGNLKWGASFQSLQSTTLAGGFLTTANRFGNGGPGSNGRGVGAGGQNSGKTEGQGTVFCRGYQRGICKHTQDHNGYFNGENRMLRHICAKCWLKTRATATHPENSDSCPLKDEP